MTPRALRVLGIDPPQGIAVLDVEPSGTASFVAAVTLECRDPGAELDVLLMEHGPTLVAVELVVDEVDGKRRGGVYAKDGFGPRMAGNLYSSGLVAGQLLDRALVRGYSVERVTAPECRRALGAKDDAAVARVIALRVRGWPKRSSVHLRDAAMVALFAAQRVRLAARVSA